MPNRTPTWLTYMMLVLLVVFTIGLLAAHPFDAEQLDLGAFAPTPFLVQFFTAAVYQLSWSIYVSDYSRYLPRDVGVRSSFWWTYLGAGVGGAWMMLVGTFAAGLFPKAETVDAVLSAGDKVFPGFGLALLIGSVLPLITIGTLNFYGGSLTLLSCVDSLKRLRPTPVKRVYALVVVGVLATAIAFASNDTFLEDFEYFLTVLGYLFTPWTAINLVDFYVVRRGHYSIREIFNPHGIYRRWSWRGLVAYAYAYAVGFAFMMPFAIVGQVHGPVAKLLGGADISMPIGLLVTAGLYLLHAFGSVSRTGGQEMNKGQLIEMLGMRLGMEKKMAAQAVDAMFDIIVRNVDKGENVTLSGFGVFEKRARAARMARNPRTGQTLRLRKTNVPNFRPGTLFKEVVDGTRKLPRVGAAKPAAKTTRTAAGKATAKATRPATKKAATVKKTAVAKKATKAKPAAKKRAKR